MLPAVRLQLLQMPPVTGDMRGRIRCRTVLTKQICKSFYR